MDLDFAVVADNAMTRPEGKFDIIGAGFDTVFVPAAPARHARFVLAIRLLLSAEEAATDHQLDAVLRTPDGDEVARAGVLIPPLPDEHLAQLPASKRAGVGLVVAFENTVFPALGDYTLSLHWHGDPVHTQDIRVAETPRPAG